LGQLALLRGRLDEAEQQFRLVLWIDKHYRGAHQALAKVFLQQGKKRQASIHLLAELRHAGEDAEALLELGQLLIEVRKIDRANAVLRKLVSLQPDNPHAEHSLAVSYLLMGQLDEGILHCRRALKLTPNSPLILYNLAQAHLQKGQINRARRYIAKALVQSPSDPQIRNLAGRLGVVGFWSTIKKRIRLRRRRDRIRK